MICEDRLIDNCKECGKGNESNSCSICEAEHFPLLENLFCFACDDPLYGQEGCKGECKRINDTNNTLYVNCQDCKQGYFNNGGICHKCDEIIPGCLDCTYKIENGVENKKCLKCSKEDGYRIIEDSTCDKCESFLSNCTKCHFVGDEGTESECDECSDGFYLTSSKTCIPCEEHFYSANGNVYCYICSKDFLEINPDDCYCVDGESLIPDKCVACPPNCEKCEYNQENNRIECLRCNPTYKLNNEKNCEKCSIKGCQNCALDENNNEICIDCGKNQYIPEEKKCLVPPDNCNDYYYDYIQKKEVCNLCNYYYVLDPISNECKTCTQVGLNNCATCIHNIATNQYECKSCNTNSVYINNTFKCLSKTHANELNCCEFAKYNDGTGKYECLKCSTNYLYISNKEIDEKYCIHFSLAKLSQNCLEVEKIGDKYSCIKCDADSSLIEDSNTNIKNCLKKEDYLPYCLEGKFENNKYICTRCVENSQFKGSNCTCNSDSFGLDNSLCYKCNDENKGNTGCDESKGCEYNNKLTCKECKDGYYDDSDGECSLCFYSIDNCKQCHDKGINKVVCDSCLNDLYVLNTENNKCELNECDEYPDISPGCIICKDKLNDFKGKNKCQRCKYGYFKTKEEKCIYCNSEKYGGPGCYECGYEVNDQGIETNNIICKSCYSGLNLKYEYSYLYRCNIPKFDDKIQSPFLTKGGKCYDCQIQFSEACKECQLINDANGIENLKCISCIDGYYLTPEGFCVNITDIIPRIPNCQEYFCSLKDVKFNFNYNNNNEHYFKFTVYNYSNYDYVSNIIYSEGLSEFKSKCIKCSEGYFLNEDGNCEKVNYEKCTFLSLLNNYNQLYKPCSDFCDNDSDYKVYIKIKLPKKMHFNNDEFSLLDSNYSHYQKVSDYLKGANEIPVCLSNLGEGGQYSPENLINCNEAYYHPETQTFICKRCRSFSYSLDEKTHLCKGNIQTGIDRCTVKNFGTEIKPLYKCDSIFYSSTIFTLITNENGQKRFKENYFQGLQDCVEATEDTTYIIPKYNCIKCEYNYIPYYSSYYERVICQSLTSEIKKEQSFYSYYSENKIKSYNGTCKKGFFPVEEGKYCYKCDDEYFNMPGCKGECSYSLKRFDSLKCDGDCKTGYFKSSEGICEKCSGYNGGCYECHYENEYPTNYKGIKRKRRFVCDFCEEGYIQSLSGECVINYELGLNNCTKGKIDPNNNDNYICTQCQNNYFINEEGKCEICDAAHFKGKNNKCNDCGNILEGGINKCLYCKSDGEKAICQQCLPGYILSISDNTCLEIAKNKELEKFINCEQLVKEDNKFICAKCNSKYTLVKRNNIKECVYIPSLFDINFDKNYQTHYYMTNRGTEKYKAYTNYKSDDYIYKKYSKYYPCQEAVNLGTEENPLYSCIKCYENLTTSNDYKPPVKITEINSNLSYCIYQDYSGYLSNCEEATFQIKEGKESFSCHKCADNYILNYDSYYRTYSCLYSTSTFQCQVHYCKTCNINNNYICEECFPDYEVNILTGSCMKKIDEIPAITWEDIYSLNMEEPSLKIRGTTKSRINLGHAFLIHLTFKKSNRLRNLEEGEDTIKMDAICTIMDEVEESSNYLNLVDYFCKGNNINNINLTNYILDLIEDGNNEQLLKPSNLNELVKLLIEKYQGLDFLTQLSTSSFTLKDIFTIIFNMDEKINDIKASDYKFKFKIEGKLNRDMINKDPIEREFEISEIDTKANCIFTVGEDLNADLSCDLNVEEYKNIRTFSFKTKEIITEDNEIDLYQLSSINLINNGKEEKEEEEKNEKKELIEKILIYGGSALGAVIIGIIIFFLIRKQRRKSFNMMQNSDMRMFNPGINPGINPGFNPGFNPNINPNYNPNMNPNNNQNIVPNPNILTNIPGAQQFPGSNSESRMVPNKQGRKPSISKIRKKGIKKLK